jgi:hypothetical protein
MHLKLGLYRHFKGHEYRVVGVARHSETMEEMVVYINTKDEKDIWVRPLQMFLETVEVNGSVRKRFEWVGE